MTKNAKKSLKRRLGVLPPIHWSVPYGFAKTKFIGATKLRLKLYEISLNLTDVSHAKTIVSNLVIKFGECLATRVFVAEKPNCPPCKFLSDFILQWLF